MSHWTQDLKTDNTNLRKALEGALLALRTIPQSRVDKARRCPDQDACCQQAYLTCAQEVDTRGQDAIREALETLGSTRL